MRSPTEGRFVYTVGNKPISARREKTGAYVGENRKLDAVFCVKGFQEFVENASAPAVQLETIRVVLTIIAYRKWNMRATGVSIAFLRSVPLRRDAYALLPDGVESGNIAWDISKPLYGLITACKNWRNAIRDFLEEECVFAFGGGGEVLP